MDLESLQDLRRVTAIESLEGSESRRERQEGQSRRKKGFYTGSEGSLEIIGMDVISERHGGTGSFPKSSK